MKGHATATLRTLRTSPRKVRLLVDLIRGKRTTVALAELMVSTKHAARPIAKLLQSAIANAKNNQGLDEKTLVIEKVTVDGGPILYRHMPKAFGRASKIRKRSSHITLVLEGDVQKGKKIEAGQATVKTEKKNVAE